MAKTLHADFLKACFMATSSPSRSWCWITKARTGHWKFLSPLLSEPWAEISLDNSGEGCRNREDPTSKWKHRAGQYYKPRLIITIYINKGKPTCIATVHPAPGNSFHSSLRRWVLFVILRSYNRVWPLEHRPLSCITVRDWTGLKTKKITERSSTFSLNKAQKFTREKLFGLFTLGALISCYFPVPQTH